MTQRQRFFAHVCVTELWRMALGKRMKDQLAKDFANMVQERGGMYPRMESYRALSYTECVEAGLVPLPLATWYRLDGRAVRTIAHERQETLR